MDFERAKLKALFYDYPVEQAVNVIMHKGVYSEDYLDVFPQIARWREPAFTISEMKALQRQINNTEEDSTENILNLLQQIANQLLTLSADGEPVIRYEHLLRWQDVTPLIGEDLLTIPYVVKRDFAQGKKRKFFLWQDILPHDNKAVNEMLDRGLTDVHAHLFASTDIFHLNWLSLMNEVDISFMRDIENKVRMYQELSIKVPNTARAGIVDYSFTHLVVAAAYIRMQFWKLLNGDDRDINLSIQKVASLLSDPIAMTVKTAPALKDDISVYKRYALRDAVGNVMDYMIPDSQINQRYKDNVYTIYAGERGFLYNIFYILQTNPLKIRQCIPLFYLYLLIKNHVRSFFVQNNYLKGFENFQEYQNRKRMALKGKPINKNYAKFAVQTSIRPHTKDHLEGRIAPERAKTYAEFQKEFIKAYRECNQSVCTQKKSVRSLHSVSLVCHFIKKDDYKEECPSSPSTLIINKSRYAEYRKQLHEQCEQVTQLYNAQRSNPFLFRGVPKLTGIDAASAELYCRPEVFAHAFRYCRSQGLLNQTYHVGEDFLDISDGLRAIDETIRFLEFDSHCRLGHAMALGIDAEKYYTKRHFHAVIPRQNYLDNCVWLFMQGKLWAGRAMSPTLELLLEQEASREYIYLGYNMVVDPFNIYEYWDSMLLRGFDIDYLDRKEETESGLSMWAQTANQHNKDIDNALKDDEGKKLYRAYHHQVQIKQKGMEVKDVKWHQDIVQLVKAIQQKMIENMAEKQISVECNPSSNCKIGYFNKYDEHPITQFHPIVCEAGTPVINASINTDDRGVFATSISREFSLMSLALKKIKDESGRQKYSDYQIIEYLEKIRQNGYSQCFQLSKDEYGYYKI